VSVAAVRWAAEQTAGGPMAKLVLLVVAEHADRHGRATTSVATLARETEASERTVRRALDTLTDRRLLARARRQRGTGADTSSAYWLNPQPSTSDRHRRHGDGHSDRQPRGSP
jgi:CTP-dependent riboflavin kinase